MEVKSKKKLSLVLLVTALVLVAISGLILNRKITQPKNNEEAIRQEFARIRAPVKERLEAKGLKDEILDLEIEGDWAKLEFGWSDTKTGEPVPAGPGIMVFRKVMGIWIGDNWGTWLFKLLVRTAPESVFTTEDKEFFLP